MKFLGRRLTEKLFALNGTFCCED